MWTWWSASTHLFARSGAGPRLCGHRGRTELLPRGLRGVYRRDLGPHAPRRRGRRGRGPLRCEVFGETDEMVARKTRRAVEAEILPIVCVGETKEERDAGDMGEGLGPGRAGDRRTRRRRWRERRLRLRADLGHRDGDTATPEDAQDAIGRIRDLLREKNGDDFAESVRSSTAAPSSRRTRLRSWPRKTSTAPWSAGASLEVESFVELIGAAERRRENRTVVRVVR